MSGFYTACKETLRDAGSTTVMLLRIMIPVSIIVKLLDEFGVISYLGTMLAPVMSFVGLPGATGLVWATAMITNIYGGLIVFVEIISAHSFTVAQATVLGSMILVAHSLPVEVSIARRAGVRVWYTILLRIGSAFLLGMILFWCFSISGILQTPADIILRPEPTDNSLLGWVINQVQNYLLIFFIIFLLLAMMKFLKTIKVLDWINKRLEPGLEKIGMSKEAAPVTMIGLTLGISYGGGIIIKEIMSGKMKDRDAFLSVSLLSLSHSLIEDTLLMVAIGASVIGILFARLFFSIAVILCILRLINYIDEKHFQYFYKRKIEK